MGSVRRSPDAGSTVAVLVFLVGSFAALSVDVPRTGFGIKGDEATYVAMALSLAHDGDLAWEAHDHERFYETYGMGPEGIFLKRGAVATYHVDPSFPFIRRDTRKDDHPDRLYFGKAFVASLAAAPFVRLAGLNGFLLLHVMLGAGMLWVGARFLAARSPGGLSTGYTVAFFGASIVPLYTLWLTSEAFMVAMVFFAYFLWFYKEVAVDAEERPGRFLFGSGSDVAAAVLLGLATFAKGPNAFLVFPPLVCALCQRRFRSCVLVGGISAAVAVGGFATNAAITGEFNHQSGLERRTFYGGTTNGSLATKLDDLVPTSGNPAVSLLTQEVGAHQVVGSSQRSVQLWPVSMVNKSSIVSDLRGWRTPSVSGEELQAPGKSVPPGITRGLPVPRG